MSTNYVAFELDYCFDEKTLSEQQQLSFSQEVLASNCYYYMLMSDGVQPSLV
jgi:hypothetical protein